MWLLVLAGLGGLVVGVSTSVIIVGVLGFLVMLGGVILAVTPTKGLGPMPVETEPQAKPQRPTSFMDRMNERWDRRQDDR